MLIPFLILLIVLFIAGFVFFYLKQYKKVSPNEVLVISSKKKYTVKAPDGTLKQIGYRFRVGGGAFINPFTEKAETLPLEVINVDIKTPEVLTGEGVPIIAEASAQVRINTDDYPLTLAIEQFLGSKNDGIKTVSETILEGQVRAVIGTMKVDEIYKNRAGFAEAVERAVKDDFDRLGLIMISFALKDISDTQGYLDALSRPKIAIAKRDAAVAQAEADRDSAIQSAQARKEAEIARLKAEAEIAKAMWENEAKKAESQVDVNKKKAHADSAYELERFKIAQILKKEEHNVKLIEKNNAIALEELEIQRKEKELESNVLKPAEAKKLQIQKETEAESFKIIEEAKAKTEAYKLNSQAEAEKISLFGKAEADSLTLKAKAYQNYNEAAIKQMVLDILPELAKSIAEPLSRVEKIVIVGSDAQGTGKITKGITEIIGQVPEVVEALTGIDIKKSIKEKLEK